ncbi:MAG TPA: hypothetical protein VLB84_05055 [Bacteroidia bacterium]|nr:hypothetical protein [Bacteroidia bacterium]
MKNYYDALDFILSQLLTENSTNPLMYFNLEDWKTKTGGKLAELYELQPWEIKCLYNKLQEDQLIDANFKFSLKGMTFIQSGGYKEQLRVDKIELRYKQLTTFSLIFGGVAAGFYYIVELVKMLPCFR